LWCRLRRRIWEYREPSLPLEGKVSAKLTDEVAPGKDQYFGMQEQPSDPSTTSSVACGDSFPSRGSLWRLSSPSRRPMADTTLCKCARCREGYHSFARTLVAYCRHSVASIFNFQFSIYFLLSLDKPHFSVYKYTVKGDDGEHCAAGSGL